MSCARIEAPLSRTPALPNAPSFTQAPGFKLLYALAAAFAWGVPIGALHGPFWPVVLGGFAAAALALWLERTALMAPSPDPKRLNVRLLLSFAYVFLAVIGVGAVSIGCFAGEWLRAKL